MAYEERWWKISKYNSQPYYGYGTEAQAQEYARLLDEREHNDVDCYQISECTSEKIEALEDEANTEGSNLEDEIPALREELEDSRNIS